MTTNPKPKATSSEFTAQSSPDDIKAGLAESRVEGTGGTPKPGPTDPLLAPCPACGRLYKDVPRHAKYQAEKGDEAHQKWRYENPELSKPVANWDKKKFPPVPGGYRPGVEVPPVGTPGDPSLPDKLEEIFTIWEGRFVVETIVGSIAAKYPDVKVPAMASDPKNSPGETWMTHAAEAHQGLLNKYVGPKYREHQALGRVLVCWFQFYLVNRKAEEDDTGKSAGAVHTVDRTEKDGKDDVGKKADRPLHPPSSVRSTQSVDDGHYL